MIGSLGIAFFYTLFFVALQFFVCRFVALVAKSLQVVEIVAKRLHLNVRYTTFDRNDVVHLCSGRGTPSGGAHLAKILCV